MLNMLYTRFGCRGEAPLPLSTSHVQSGDESWAKRVLISPDQLAQDLMRSSSHPFPGSDSFRYGCGQARQAHPSDGGLAGSRTMTLLPAVVAGGLPDFGPTVL